MLPDRYPLPTFTVQTSAVENILSRIDLSLGVSPPIPVHIVGRAGTGKSTALRMIAKERRYHYVEAEYASKNVEGLYAAILRDCAELYDIPKWRAKKVAAVEELLAPSWYGLMPHEKPAPKALIVDEIQQLELTALRQLLQTAERSGALLVLAGNERGLVSGRNRPKEDLEPITSRLSIPIKIEGCTITDCELIASQFGVEGMQAFRACSNYGIEHNLRELVSLLEIARQLAIGSTVTMDAIEQAAVVKHGQRKAVNLLTQKKKAAKGKRNDAA